MKRASTFLAVVAAVAVIMTGCSSVPPSQKAGGFILMSASEPPTAVMQAMINGTLTTTDSGCFAITSGEVTYPLQFPYGTVLSDDGRTVRVPGVEPLEVGDSIQGGGGFVKLDTVPAGCEAPSDVGQFAVWQTIEQ